MLRYAIVGVNVPDATTVKTWLKMKDQSQLLASREFS
jgi:hypothetical protein